MGRSTVGVNDLVLEAGCYLFIHLFIYSTSLLFCIARDSTPPTMKILVVPWDICQESGKRGFHGFRSWWGEVSMFSSFDLSSLLKFHKPQPFDSPTRGMFSDPIPHHLQWEHIWTLNPLKHRGDCVSCYPWLETLRNVGNHVVQHVEQTDTIFFVNPPQDILVSSLKCWFGRSKRLVWAFFRVGLVTFLMGHQLNSTILWCWIYFSSYTRSFPLILKC